MFPELPLYMHAQLAAELVEALIRRLVGQRGLEDGWP
jgi:hypothetical protein